MSKDVQMLAPVQDFVHMYDGIEYSYSSTHTRLPSDTERIQGILDLFRPIESSDRVEAATAAPGELRGA